MKIGIIGTRGIPNHHGGFEQFTDFFAQYAQQKGHQVFVYNSSLHPYKEKFYNEVTLIHQKDWEDKLGTFGQFIYDLNCILDARQRNFDILLQLGYTSSSIWYFLLPKSAIVVTNMDGLEWKRSKYNKYVQQFLKFAEKLAIKSSKYLVSDSIGIQEYIQEKYNRNSTYIAYGTEIVENFDEKTLTNYHLSAKRYDLLIARMEPENNIETIIKAYLQSQSPYKLYLVGKPEATHFGNYLVKKYGNESQIVFLGGIYNLEMLNNLRYFSRFYFHGHSVGGTNPSLLEAMGSHCLIMAHRNPFNQSILQENAFYFSDENELSHLINTVNFENETTKSEQNILQIKKHYTWEKINESYLQLFEKIIENEKSS